RFSGTAEWRLEPRTNGERSVRNGQRRVVITGVGAVTPIGTGADGLWAGLAARSSAVREITRFDPAPFRSRIAAEIPDFRPQDHLDAKRAKRLDRFSQLAVTNAMSCASGTIAVGEAFHTIREGRADVMLAGGAEAPLAPMTYAAFSVIRAMSTRNDDPAHASRPFDEDRDGFVMGEGAAVLVL